jgi:hypothetical protein
MAAFAGLCVVVLLAMGAIKAAEWFGGGAPPHDVEGERRPIPPSGSAPRA